MKLSADLALSHGEFRLEAAFELDGHAALVGPNGSGKTSLLDALAGLVRPERGRVALGERVLSDAAVFVPPAERGLGYVFQDGALFPHLTVAANVAYPTEVRRGRDRSAPAQLLERFELTRLADRLPAQLSAGERQRVALARAVAAEPRWLLLDEPFATIDAAARPDLRAMMLDILTERGVPALWVTHDPEEALGLAGDVLVLTGGRLVEHGPAEELLHRPTSAFAAALAGLNHYLGTVEASADGLLTVRVGAARLAVRGERRVGDQVAVVVSPGEVILSVETPHTSARNAYRLEVEQLVREADGCRVRLAGELTIAARITLASAAELGLAEGAEVTAFFKVTAARLC